MNKLCKWCKENLLLLFSLFLLAFIPLYPKLPLIDVQHVWVYVRLEDFFVLFALLYWGILVIRKKNSLRTPLTLPILMFWLVGAISTLNGMLVIFPDLANVFPNVAFLTFLRHIEYISVFFIAFSAFKDKRVFSYLVTVLILTVLAVILYGIGQKYFSLPAYLTMNEQFAKGIAIQLSSLSRVSSTFGGQYDLAAYLILTLPIIVSLVFGYKNWFIRISLLTISALGVFVLFLTVSRIALVAIFVAFLYVLFTENKKIVLISVPVMAVVVIFILSISPTLLARFGNTVKDINVLVDANTGDPIGQAIVVPKDYFKNKIVKQQNFTNISGATASPSAELTIPYDGLPSESILYVQPNVPNGEFLPQGTSYINLTLSPITQKTWNFYYETNNRDVKTGLPVVTIINGQYLLKTAAAYDLSFTTRFQGEWPNAMVAFKRNIMLGSGYGSVSLAVDNNYLRTLAEVGVLGFISFFSIIIGFLIYVKRVLPVVDSKPVKNFIVGFCAGILGLLINAFFIDVFEASKVAFVFWLITGAIVAILHLYQKAGKIQFDFFRELRSIATSKPAIIIYLLISTILFYSLMLRNYFVGDDFTWFRWAANCTNQAIASMHCPITLETIINYFTQSPGFFYRPGMKIYFLTMYDFFWLNQTMYHVVSLILHFLVAALVYLIAGKIFKNNLLSALAGFLFLTISGLTETVFWISATGFLFTSVFSLLSLFMYILWSENRKKIYFALTLIFMIFSMLFHELGVVTPILILLYQWLMVEPVLFRQIWKNIYIQLLFLPVPFYLIARYVSGSLWMSGDYSYNFLKLPFNIVGNTLGYLSLTLFGQLSLPVYDALRNIFKVHTLWAVIFGLIIILLIIICLKKTLRFVKKDELRLIKFGSLFFFIALLPFIGLGNISSRYGYLASIGIVFLLVYFIKKLQEYLFYNGKEIAAVISTLVVIVFMLWQLVSIQQAHVDWFGAGETVRNFFTSMESAYDDTWKSGAMELHFVNVPIKHGNAWVFPVGLPDAVWFVIRNPNIKVFTWPTLKDAFNAVQYGSKTQKVFVFNADGTLTQEIKTSSD